MEVLVTGLKVGVKNGSSNNVGLGKFWPDLEISDVVVMGLEISFRVVLCLGGSNFETRVWQSRKVSTKFNNLYPGTVTRS